MRKSLFGGFPVALLIVGVMAMLPAAAARAPYERVLHGITLKSTYLEVMATRGTPHYIGPSVGGTDMLLSVLDPAETPPAPAATAPTKPTGGRPAPGSAAGMPTGEGGPTPAEAEAKRYMVWMYEGAGATPDPGAGWVTYVFLNRLGEVEGVTVAITKQGAKPPVRTESGVTFGARMTELVKEDLYGWPQPFRKIGAYFFLHYPDKNITFALDPKTRAVVQISMGLPMLVSSIQIQAENAGTPAAGGDGAETLPTYPAGGAQRTR